MCVCALIIIEEAEHHTATKSDASERVPNGRYSGEWPAETLLRLHDRPVDHACAEAVCGTEREACHKMWTHHTLSDEAPPALFWSFSPPAARRSPAETERLLPSDPSAVTEPDPAVTVPGWTTPSALQFLPPLELTKLLLKELLVHPKAPMALILRAATLSDSAAVLFKRRGISADADSAAVGAAATAASADPPITTGPALARRLALVRDRSTGS